MLYAKEHLLNSTPSRRDGIDITKETQLRKTYVNFIRAIAKQLKLWPGTVETACVFAHRYFAQRSIAKNDRFLVATAALFLSCKVTESPRSLSDVAYVMFQTKNANKPEELAKLRGNKNAILMPLMDNIMLGERAMLYTLGFDLHVDHPYTTLVSSLQKLGITVEQVAEKGAQERNVFQVAQNMLNDSLSTTLSLQYSASKLAIAVIYKVSELVKLDLAPYLPEGTSYQEFMDISDADLNGIIDQLMTCYASKPKPAITGPSIAPIAAASGKANGPPIPTFRTVILAGENGKTPSPAPSAMLAATLAPVPVQAPQSSEIEEGELLVNGLPAKHAPQVAATSAALAPAPAGPVAAALSPLLADSDGGGIGHAPGSGDQNNHNDTDNADEVEAPASSISRKRTRSPDAVPIPAAAAGADMDGDGSLPRAKSPRSTPAA